MHNSTLTPMPPSAALEQRSPTQAVDRALSILGVLARRGPTGITDLAREMGVHKSTASRLVSALEKHRLVEQVGNRGKYRLGFGIVRLAGATAAQLDIAAESRPVCSGLAAELGGTVGVGVLEAGHATTIVQEPLTERNRVGLRTPLHATAAGKVLLTSFGPEALDEVLGRPLRRCTPWTRTSRGTLLADLARSRDRGWAATTSEFEVGLTEVAVPVRGAGGRTAGALCSWARADRLPPSDFPRTARMLREAADEIGARLTQLATP